LRGGGGDSGWAGGGSCHSGSSLALRCAKHSHLTVLRKTQAVQVIPARNAMDTAGDRRLTHATLRP
jgi:hypothetical protein